MEERNHPATERQRQRFSERGEIPRSKDLVTFGALVGGLIAIWAFSDGIISALDDMLAGTFGQIGQPIDSMLGMQMAEHFTLATTPILIGCLVGTLALGFGQAGGKLVLVAPKLDVTRLNPLSKLQKMLGSVQSLVNVGMSMLKVSVLVVVCALTIAPAVTDLLTDRPKHIAALLSDGAGHLGTLFVRVLGAVLALGLIDFLVNRTMLERKMRMSTKDLRDEAKEEAGDPQVRAKRRRRQQEMARQRSLRDVPKADVIVVNPTHYAVAVLYKTGMAAPKVVAKGADDFAARIRDIARRSNVPIVSDPPLARTLFARVSVGKDIEPDLYQAVAALLAYVYRMPGRTA